MNAEVMRVLSRRELEVLKLVATGASNAQVAGSLQLSLHTVKKHLAKVFLKLKIASRSEAALQYRAATRECDEAIAAAAGHAPARALEGLTAREREVLERIAEGANNQRIAADLALSLNTVKRHTTKIYTKLGVRSRVKAAAVLHAGAFAESAAG